MKLETFFEKFDQFADIPDAVSKLRKVIMSLAFSGALFAEKRDNPMPAEWAIEGAPMLPSIPTSWKWQHGSEVFDVIRGVSYKKHDASDFPIEGSFPLLRANNIGSGINLYGLVYVPGENIREEQFVRRGDILIAMSSGSKKLVGKAAPIITEFKGSFGAFCSVIRNKSEIPDGVLARFFESPQYTSWVTAAGRGIGINNLKKGDLDSLPIPTPPLAEQKRIVAKVDELMALCDRLETQQQEHDTRHSALSCASLAQFADAPTPDSLNFLFHQSYSILPADLRKAILTLAAQGKLVPQAPNDEPVGLLLSRIDSARTELQKAGIVPKQRALSEIAANECHHSIPDTWKWVRLQSVAEIIDPNPSHRMPNYCVSGIPFISTENFVGRVEIDFTIGKQVDEVELDDQKKRFNIRPGSFALSRIGTIGKTRILPLKRNYCMSHALVVISPYSQDIDPSFLRSVVSSDAVQGQASQGAKSIGVPDLGMGKIRSFVVPIPPLAEQRRIVAKVDQLMATVDELETQLAAARTTGKNLLEALVAELTAAGALSSKGTPIR